MCAQTARGRYALILENPPTAERFASKEAIRSAEAAACRRQIENRQRILRTELASRGIRVTGAVSTVLSAIFVTAPKDRLAELKSLPGVKGVVPMRRYHMELNRATQLLDAPAAWNVVGGVQSAGSGIEIAILDSGIDQTHPAFQDSSLPMPAGYPICSGGDCAFTSNTKHVSAPSHDALLGMDVIVSGRLPAGHFERSTGTLTRICTRSPPKNLFPSGFSTEKDTGYRSPGENRSLFQRSHLLAR